MPELRWTNVDVIQASSHSKIEHSIKTMQPEARQVLEKLAQDMFQQFVVRLVAKHHDLHQSVRSVIAVEFCEGYLHGVYQMWCMSNGGDPADDYEEVIEEIVKQYNDAIQAAVEEFDNQIGE